MQHNKDEFYVDRLTLKQLGLTYEQVASIEKQYKECADQRLSFIDYAISISNTIKFYKLRIDWQPKSTTIESLVKEGYSQSLIKYVVGIFIVKARESGRVIRYPDRAFSSYIKKAYSLERTGRLSNATYAELAIQGICRTVADKAIDSIAIYAQMKPNDIPESSLIALIKGITQ